MLFPAIRFVYQVGTGEYGILPIALGGMTYWSGVWATAILLMTLAVTPALTILRWPALVDVRRMIGVTALAFTIAHVVIYFALRLWNFPSIATEMATRLTLVVATLSTIGLIALGATSLATSQLFPGESLATLRDGPVIAASASTTHWMSPLLALRACQTTATR
jgi:sulfoxide reductase heme-binding subunit YedZ